MKPAKETSLKTCLPKEPTEGMAAKKNVRGTQLKELAKGTD